VGGWLERPEWLAVGFESQTGVPEESIHKD
jgi:hypothetical protein